MIIDQLLIRIVNHSKNVTLKFDDASRQCGEVFRGKYKGKVFVTTHRMIFLSDDARDNLISFAVAFLYMKNLRVEQPIFGANYISGTAAAHPNGKIFLGELNERRVEFIRERNRSENLMLFIPSATVLIRWINRS